MKKEKSDKECQHKYIISHTISDNKYDHTVESHLICEKCANGKCVKT